MQVLDRRATLKLLLAVLATWKARDVRPLVPVAQVFE